MGSSDMPPNSLRDPKVGPRVKQQQKKIEACSLIHITSKVGGCVKTPK